MKPGAELLIRLSDVAEGAAHEIKAAERAGTPLEQKEIRNYIKAAIQDGIAARDKFVQELLEL